MIHTTLTYIIFYIWDWTRIIKVKNKKKKFFCGKIDRNCV